MASAASEGLSVDESLRSTAVGFQRRLVLNGRHVAWAEYGDPSGRPVLYCHGSPGSRLDLARQNDVIGRAGVRLIAPDRPGIGLSDFVPGYRLRDWPATVARLADAIELDRFAVVGLSGGGPFAVACAAKLPERVTRLAVVSGIGPIGAPEARQGLSVSSRTVFRLARWAPWLLRLQYAFMAYGIRRDPDRVVAEMKRNLPTVDRSFLEGKPGEAESLLATIREAFRNGTGGTSREWFLIVRPWGLRFSDIAVPSEIWHGEEDMNAPVAMGRQMAAALPNCTAHILSGEGHFSLVGQHLGNILTSVVR